MPLAFSCNSVGQAATTTTIATIAVGNGPKGVGVNPETNLIYVASEFSNEVSVIDGSTGEWGGVTSGHLTIYF